MMKLLVLASKYHQIKRRLISMVQAFKGKGAYKEKGYGVRDREVLANYNEIEAILYAFNEAGIIGWDVCSPALDELMHLFYPNRAKLWEEAFRQGEQIYHNGPLNARPGT